MFCKLLIIAIRPTGYYNKNNKCGVSRQTHLLSSYWVISLRCYMCQVRLEAFNFQQQPATLDQALLIAQNREIYFNPENQHSSTLNNISSSALNYNWYENLSYDSDCSNELCMEPNNYGSDHDLSENNNADFYSVNHVTENQIQPSSNCEEIYNNAFQQAFANLDSEMGNAMPIPR